LEVGSRMSPAFSIETDFGGCRPWCGRRLVEVRKEQGVGSGGGAALGEEDRGAGMAGIA
jgi:hypothetical protein